LNSQLFVSSIKKPISPQIQKMKRDIWFIIETIHFILGLGGCLINPRFVMNAYTLHPEDVPNVRAYEMMRVVAMYYSAFVALSYYSTFNTFVRKYFSITLVIFYSGLSIYDLYDIITIGYSANTGRYADTVIHLVFGLVAGYKYYVTSKKLLKEGKDTKTKQG